MHNRIRLIAVDLDGTLLQSDRTPHPESVTALMEAARSGRTVCMASGRAFGTMLPYRESTGIVGPFVCSNGALGISQDLVTLWEHKLTGELQTALLDYAENFGVHTNIYFGEKVVLSGDGAWADLYRSRVAVGAVTSGGFELMRGYPATKLLMIDTPENHAKHAKKLSEVVRQFGGHMTISEPEYLEFLPPDTNKGSGVRALAGHLGLSMDEVAAIGDWHNDLEMIVSAGFGGAVGNAARDIRDAADVVVGTNDDGGVAEFVKLALA